MNYKLDVSAFKISQKLCSLFLNIIKKKKKKKKKLKEYAYKKDEFFYLPQKKQQQHKETITKNKIFIECK